MSVKVDPLWGMASTFIETQFMLVHGGSPGSNVPPVGRTFALKLDTNWNTSQPDIEALRDDFQGFNIASALSSDNKTWLIMANAIPHKFRIDNGTWSQDPSYPSFTAKGGLGAATDPETGLIYVINGFSTNGSSSMLQYNLDTRTSYPLPMHPALVTLSDAAVVWSKVRKSMLVHGGWGYSYPPSLLQGLYEFVPDGGYGTWTLLLDKGDRPEPRKGHCLVPAYGGSKMILFGGLLGSGERAASDVYSLDVKTLTWSKLTDPGELYARAYHACAVSNDMFVSWGGSDSTYNVTNTNVTLVYNLKMNVWQDTFSPQPQEAVSVPPYSSLSLAAIIGIVAGIIGIVIAAGYVVYRRKQRPCEPASVSCADSVAADHSLGGGYINSPKTSTKKDLFRPFKFKAPNSNGKDTGHLLEAVGVQHKQEPLYMRDSMLSHSSVDSPAVAHQKHFFVAPVSNIGGDLEGDDAMYRPNEIIFRGPQAIIDTSGYQDCKSTARGPQTIQ
ncbi:hypothetical protein BGZ75_001371 [Mortierella antarctica]|nr:hypothetical protein BGZ75_001371 [Mortierella antarctica]